MPCSKLGSTAHLRSSSGLQEEQRGERERGRESRSLATTAGVRLAAETLYKEVPWRYRGTHGYVIIGNEWGLSLTGMGKYG